MKKLLTLAVITVLILSACNKFSIYEFSLEPNEITMFSTEQRGLNAAISFAGRDSVLLVWSSDNPSVATVNQAGLVTAIEPGDAVISVECCGEIRTCRITVQPETFILLNPAGTKAGIPSLWKNGTLTPLNGAKSAIALGMSVIGTDTYIAGSALYSTSDSTSTWQSVYWNNSSLTRLDNSAYHSEANSVSKVDKDIYVVGYTTDSLRRTHASLWKNSDFKDLGLGLCNKIIGYNDGKYISAGYSITDSIKVPTYWTDNNIVSIENTNGEIKDFIIIDNNIYGVGYIVEQGDTIAALWINENLKKLSTSGSKATAIAAYHDNIYVAGERKNGIACTPLIWNITTEEVFTLESAFGYVELKGISVTNQGIMTVGVGMQRDIELGVVITPILWINNTISPIFNFKDSYIPKAIFCR